jgi:hypothetical protein
MTESDPQYIAQQYSTDEALRIQIETHRQYGRGPKDDIFVRMTRVMAGPLLRRFA